MRQRLPSLLLPGLLVLLLLAPGPAWALVDSHGQEPIGPAGHVDWIRKTAVATGQGFPPSRITEPERRRQFARRAAVLDARRNLLEVIQGVRLHGSTRLQEGMAAHDVVRAEVDGLLTHSVIEALEDMPDGSAQARVSVELRLAGLEFLLPTPPRPATPDPRLPGAVHGDIKTPAPPATSGEPGASGESGESGESGPGDTPFLAPEVRGLVQRSYLGESPPVASEPPPVQVPQIRSPQADPAAPEQSEGPSTGMVPTGIVVDARGLGFEPSLAPSLHDEAGELYPAGLLTAETISTEGIVRYYRDLFPALSSKTAGDAPLVLKGKQIVPGRPDALLLGPEEAQRLRAAAGAPGSPLRRGRVIIVF
ncbi:hypothetical protein [Megalodesulfovibrio gigas]|uniref:Uncharacterized protein n=1 Tax=Megalodesulfovibrio gigas (strain ATCC 19364 / DSM 1382 / NCIMB 9332 / VKM B-1759) TaxID=1121448 RepID=T2GFZ9_MEGG1|nr:hypothetical protein [Megalodesulfovibrio gigas]AGW15134.1 hypothetical protein DGI_3454 [Megalodesulfovibrio gigas DSM 1382 = ATCC 19364]